MIGLPLETFIGCFGMSYKKFHKRPVDQVRVLPPSVDGHVSDGSHLALFVCNLVGSRLDIPGIGYRKC